MSKPEDNADGAAKSAGAADPKAADPKAADPKAAGPKAADPKANGGKTKLGPRRRLRAAAPYIFGVVLALVYAGGVARYQPPDTMKDLLSSVLNVAAIAVGFLSTAKSILFSIENRKAIKQLKQSGQWESLLAAMLSAVHWSMGLALASGLCLLFLDSQNWWIGSQVATTVWIWVMGTAFGLYVRVVRSPREPWFTRYGAMAVLGPFGIMHDLP